MKSLIKKWMNKLGKKGAFDVADLYNFVLLLVLVGIAIGVGVLVLDKFGASSGVTVDAETALNASRDEIGNIASDWLSIIVIVVIAEEVSRECDLPPVRNNYLGAGGAHVNVHDCL